LKASDLAHALRFLSMDMVQKAQSGHPGAPMGLADVMSVLWREVLSHSPLDRGWTNRDRFVLSNGHAAALLYSVLHLSGYPLSLEELKNFRQWHSQTPGHPEYGCTPGVEATTGPLGQGLGMAVGMALARQLLAQHFNQPDFPLVDHYVYSIVGDGCLMEGVSHEVCSLAGTLGLSQLIVLWDDNGISMDGELSGWFSEDVPQRFRSYGWHVLEKVDAHNVEEIRAALQWARGCSDKPVLICCKTIIGYGSYVAGTAAAHGAPLGEEEIARLREQWNWPYPAFDIPEDIRQAWDGRDKGRKRYQQWQVIWTDYQKHYPALAQEYRERVLNREQALSPLVEASFDALIQRMHTEKASLATRQASQKVLQEVLPLWPILFGGSADVTTSTLSKGSGSVPYLHYGVREFGMGTIMNGLALYGGFIPYGSTFLTFIDYAKNALRLAALMRVQVIWILTHDSIGVGEDGPTHQPIEQMAALRATPGVQSWRPADAVETIVAWKAAVEYVGPTCLLLSRQTLPFLSRSREALEAIHKGGYIVWEPPGTLRFSVRLVLIGTGSELSLCIAVAQKMAEEGLFVRVVSLPCWERFFEQSHAYREQVLPVSLPRCSVEASATFGWERFCGRSGDRMIGIDHFGASAPAAVLYKKYGITEDDIMQVLREMGKDREKGEANDV
jgi:transketolase